MDILNRYRDNHDSSSSSDNDSENSDNECVWKRAKNTRKDNEHFQNNGMHEEPVSLLNDQKEEVTQSQQLPEESKPKTGEKRKRNNIWSDVLQDQLMSEDLEDCLLNKPRNYGSRGKESYDYTRAHSEKKRDSENEMSARNLNDDSDPDSWAKSKRMRRSFPNQKPFRKFVKLNYSELATARKINKVLQEKKYYLIQRVVKYAGIDKAINYLEMTKQIEDDGGMMTKDQSRRRTPGGVYLQLLKSDKDITKEIIDKVFEGELSGFDQKKRFEERRRRWKNVNKNSKYNFKEDASVEPMELHTSSVDDKEIMEEEKNINLDIESTSVPIIDNKPPEIISNLEEEIKG